MSRENLKDDYVDEDLLDEIFDDLDEDEYFPKKTRSSKRQRNARRKIEQYREDRDLQRRLDESYL